VGVYLVGMYLTEYAPYERAPHRRAFRGRVPHRACTSWVWRVSRLSDFSIYYIFANVELFARIAQMQRYSLADGRLT
jgi:hypothetical protein